MNTDQKEVNAIATQVKGIEAAAPSGTAAPFFWYTRSMSAPDPAMSHSASCPPSHRSVNPTVQTTLIDCGSSNT